MKLEHSQLPEHQASLTQQLREFWLHGHLCDVVLKSQDGMEHRCHRLVLSAASSALKALLSEGFREGEQIRQGAAIEVGASSGALRVVVDYVYGGKPEVSMQDSVELLRLADAYGLPQLATEVESQLLASLDSSTAFQLLQHASALGMALREACEDMIAGDFESCMQQASFLDLSSTQLARFLKRDDLCVTREESVLEGLWRWLKASKDRAVFFGPMLQMVDFLALSSGNLERVRSFAQSLGPNGTDLQTEVDAATRKRRCLEDSTGVRPKRQRLTHWSAELGAHSGGVGVKFLDGQLEEALSFCFHDGYIYIADLVADKGRIFRWKPDTEQVQVVAGEGAPINGVNDLGSAVTVAVSPKGEVVVADWENSRLVSFANGTGTILVDMNGIGEPIDVVFSPSGVLYVLGERQVWRLEDGALHAVVEWSTQNPDTFLRMAVSKDEHIYIATRSPRSILKFRPADSEPTEVWKVDGEGQHVWGLSIVGDTVYAADEKKILAFRRGGRCAEVVNFKDLPNSGPVDVLVQAGSLYALHVSGFVSKHPLPVPINLPADEQTMSAPL